MPLNCLIQSVFTKTSNLKTHGVIKSVNGGMTQWNGHQTREIKEGPKKALKICGLYRHTVLHFTNNAFFANYCGNPASSKCISAIFPMVFAHFMSPCHISVIPTVFKTVSSLLYLWQWPAISDLWCDYLKMTHQIMASNEVFSNCVHF